MKPIARHLRSNVIAYIALFVSLSASAYALPKIGSNDIKPDAVKSKHVAAESLTGKDIDGGSLRLADIAAWRVDSGNLTATLDAGECRVFNSGGDARARGTDVVLAAPAPGGGTTPDGITLDAAITQSSQVTPISIVTVRICNVTEAEVELPDPYSLRFTGLR